MAWKKVIVSGSVASLSEVSASVGFKGNLVGAVTGNATTATTATQVGNSLTVDDSTIQLNSGTTYDGAAARTISVKNSGITLAKIANQANNTVLGNVSGGAAAPSALTAANIRTLISVEEDADVTDATNVAAAGALMDSELSDITAVKGINQDLTTTSAVSFATVNTGQGANELYDMDQNVKTTSSPTFNDVTVSDELKVNDYARIDALRVGTTNTDPGDGNLYVENDLTVAGKIFQGTSDTVYFEAQCTGGTSVANATYTKVEYNSEAVDLGGDYSTTYDRFTAPVNGVYFFRAQFLWSNASNWDSGDNPIIGFSVNDVDASDGRFMIRTGNFTEYFSMQTTAIIKLDASDTVHVDAYQNTGTTLYIYDGGGEGSYNQFMGTLIHALT